MKNRIRLLLLFTALTGFFTGCTRIDPDEIGVRTYNFGTHRGIASNDYGPGYHRAIWILDTWHRFPRTVQRLQFLKETGMARIDSQIQPPLQLTSSGGDKVIMDAEVFFRIAEGQANKILQNFGPEKRYEGLVREMTVDAARASFGQLKTEDFYTPARRETARWEAIQKLKERLKTRGIELIDFLVETIEFAPEYERLIKQKKIADQQVQLELSKMKAAEEKGKVDRIKVETTVKLQKKQRETDAEISRITTETELLIAKMKAEADQYAVERKSDADLYKSRREAEGQRLKKTAEAEGTQRMNQALTGEGSENIAALEAARNLQLNEITFPSGGIEWFNPVEMARRLGAEAVGNATESKR